METLETLVRRAKAGDRIAFGEIVSRLSRRAVGTAHLITGDFHLGEEAAQDALVTAWRKLGSLKDPAAFPAWFGKILARTAQRARRRPPVALAPDLVPGVPEKTVGEEPGLPEEAARLRPKYRDVLALRYVEGLSYRGIAAALGITVARVKSRLHDGRELLRERLADRRRRT
ncbi:MAG: RNA polymerase sigma factor [Planctomycetota bacterium]|jgi:RNA polymerase sigma-70 factor (ECF subfamily)